jgi:hypothetical protein
MRKKGKDEKFTKERADLTPGSAQHCAGYELTCVCAKKKKPFGRPFWLHKSTAPTLRKHGNVLKTLNVGRN